MDEAQAAVEEGPERSIGVSFVIVIVLGAGQSDGGKGNGAPAGDLSGLLLSSVRPFHPNQMPPDVFNADITPTARPPAPGPDLAAGTRFDTTTSRFIVLPPNAY